MGILDWLKHVTQGGDGTATLQFEAGEEEFHGLNMKEAMDAHTAWTRRIEGLLRGTDASTYTVAEVADDHQCVLGEWIHGAAMRRFGGLPEYRQLRSVHAEFHQTVGRMLNDIEFGQDGDAPGFLRAMRHASGEVQLALIRLYAAVENPSA